MIKYGVGPAPDEFEVTLFGPGYGEALAIHLGEHHWILVDSCMDPDSKIPASSTYLKQICIDPDKVDAIIASHWHDDHVCGISKLATEYSNADFIISSIFNNKEAAYFLAAYSGICAPGQAKGAKELFEVIKQRSIVHYVHQQSNVLEINLTGRQIRVTALSPVYAAISQSIANIAQYLPRKGGGSPINHAPDLKPNIESVAIHIDFGDDAVLLGSDLEEHAKFGWSAVVADRWCSSRRPGTAYKVAHHGSYTGDLSEIWSMLLQPDPVVCMTPFIRGSQKLPAEDDKTRIKANTSHRYISSGSSRKPEMDNTQLKRLSDICANLSRVNPGFGAVRLRKRLGGASWETECFGDAQKF